MRKSKLHYIKLNKMVDESKLLEMFENVYNNYVKNIIFVNENVKKNECYKCWKFEDSYLELDKYTYLWKLPSGFSPNDTAGSFTFVEADSNPIVLDLNTDINTYPPVGFKFSSLKDVETKANEFFNEIKYYKDINEGNFFYKTKKQELIDMIKINNISVDKFNNLILDKIDECYLNDKFDPNASKEINEEFWNLFNIASKTLREIFIF